MWPKRSFRIEQCRVVEVPNVLVVARHQSGGLRLPDLPLHLFLFGLTQSCDVTTVYPAGVTTLEL